MNEKITSCLLGCALMTFGYSEVDAQLSIGYYKFKDGAEYRNGWHYAS